MTRPSASPKTVTYAALAGAALLAAVVTGSPALVAMGGPFALALLVGLALADRPTLTLSASVPVARVVEGDRITVDVDVSADGPVSRVELAVAASAGLRPVAGRHPRAVPLRAGQTRRVTVELSCPRWGAHSVAEVVARYRDRGGLSVYEQRAPLDAVVRVYPRQETMRRLLRPADTQVLTGNQTARAKGDGMEFADIRAYAPGDRVRDVNWRVTARRGTVWVNERHPDRNTDIVVFIDAFTAVTLDAAVRAAASLVSAYLRERDRVGLVSFGATLRWMRPGMGLRQLYRIIDALLDTRVAFTYAWKDLTVVPPGILPPRALVLALSPLLDERSTAALIDLRARGIDLVVIEVDASASVAPAAGEEGELAYRLWRLRQSARRAHFRSLGIPVVAWRDKVPLQALLEEVREFRRHARRPVG